MFDEVTSEVASFAQFVSIDFVLTVGVGLTDPIYELLRFLQIFVTLTFEPPAPFKHYRAEVDQVPTVLDIVPVKAGDLIRAVVLLVNEPVPWVEVSVNKTVVLVVFRQAKWLKFLPLPFPSTRVPVWELGHRIRFLSLEGPTCLMELSQVSPDRLHCLLILAVFD